MGGPRNKDVWIIGVYRRAPLLFARISKDRKKSQPPSNKGQEEASGKRAFWRAFGALRFAQFRGPFSGYLMFRRKRCITVASWGPTSTFKVSGLWLQNYRRDVVAVGFKISG